MLERAGLPPRSLTGRLLALFTLTTLLILVVSAWHLDRHLTEVLLQDQVEFLEDTIDVLRAVLRERPGDLEWLHLEVEGETSARSNQPTYLRVLDSSGAVLAETEGMAEKLPEAFFVDLRPGAGPSGRPGPAGHHFLLEVSMLEGGEGEHWSLHAALDTTHTLELLAGYRTTLYATLGLGVLLALLGGMFITRTGLAPLREIGQVAQRITVKRLGERIGGRPWPSELVEIAHSFDAMLERLEEAFRRISEFSDDMAHELRTPLTNLRGETEVALSSVRSPDELRDVLASNLEELQRLAVMVDDMLFLARSENPQRVLSRERVELPEVLGAVLDLYEPLAEESRLQLSLEAEGTVVANPDLLRRAVSNLVANALQHTPAEGRVRIEARARADGAVEVRVLDTGPGLPAGLEERVFERFYRSERSRGPSGGGSGLGLSIVRRIMDLHGGTARVDTRRSDGLEMVLTFPAADEP